MNQQNQKYNQMGERLSLFGNPTTTQWRKKQLISNKFPKKKPTISNHFSISVKKKHETFHPKICWEYYKPKTRDGVYVRTLKIFGEKLKGERRWSWWVAVAGFSLLAPDNGSLSHHPILQKRLFSEVKFWKFDGIPVRRRWLSIGWLIGLWLRRRVLDRWIYVGKKQNRNN